MHSFLFFLMFTLTSQLSLATSKFDRIFSRFITCCLHPPATKNRKSYSLVDQEEISGLSENNLYGFYCTFFFLFLRIQGENTAKNKAENGAEKIAKVLFIELDGRPPRQQKRLLEDIFYPQCIKHIDHHSDYDRADKKRMKKAVTSAKNLLLNSI